MDRQRRTCGSPPPVLLTFVCVALFGALGSEAFVTPINSGNACRKAARRGRGTFVPYKDWLHNGWPAGQRAPSRRGLIPPPDPRRGAVPDRYHRVLAAPSAELVDPCGHDIWL